MQIIFDMDGTIADFYKPKDWLERLMNEDETLYSKAEPLGNIEKIIETLQELRKNGHHIIISSWRSKKESKDFAKKVRKAKIEWLKKYNFPYDEIHIVKYGTNKFHTIRNKEIQSILFDDNEKVCIQFMNSSKKHGVHNMVALPSVILPVLTSL